MARLLWVQCPTTWITPPDADVLPRFTWGKGGGSSHTSALMCLTAIIHNADQKTGIARVNYDQFETITGRSRSSISNGLSVLKEPGLIERGGIQSEYIQTTFDADGGWGKFPSKQLYSGDSIRCFQDFRLRSRTELDALKLMYLFVAFRDRRLNFAAIGYDKITEKTKINRNDIPRALSLLCVNGLVHIDKVSSAHNEYSVANHYRVCGIEPYNHAGTRGREDLAAQES